ncbi:MAG TPA: heme-binding protein [Pseudonocardiaceae bacterium]
MPTRSGRPPSASSPSSSSTVRPTRPCPPSASFDLLSASLAGFVPWAGGVLITDGELIIGAAGASGARAVEDELVVATAVERWQDRQNAAQ